MKNDSLLSYSIIADAVCGEPEAVKKVIMHYNRYITTLATRTMFDAYGEPHICVDITLKNRLESKLLSRIGSFDLNKSM